jgi:hypothetical protein
VDVLLLFLRRRRCDFLGGDGRFLKIGDVLMYVRDQFHYCVRQLSH